jgi:phosphate starvation-inducible PhoH-like protein
LSRNRALKAKTRMNTRSQENTIDFHNAGPRISPRPIELVPRSRNQEKLVLALQNPQSHIVITVGPAGTGKTYLAMQAAVRALRLGTCERIVMTRPAVGVEDERHGFLPGDLVAKMEPWTRPLLDVLREYYRPQDIVRMMEDQVIEISPLAYMRGRTFKQSWVIADEMQNATPAQVKMLMTRIGQNSRIVITGDVEQADRQGSNNGLLDLVQRISQQAVDGIDLCQMGMKDVQRHPLIGPILDLYQRDR